VEISFFRDLKNIDQGHTKVKGHGQRMKKKFGYGCMLRGGYFVFFVEFFVLKRTV